VRARIVALAVLVLSLASTGCQFAMVPAVAPTIDTQGHVGVEGKIDLVASLGSETGMLAIGLGGPGGGYHQQLGGYYSHSVDLGARYGDIHARPIVRGRSSVVFSPRVSRYGAHGGVGGFTELMVGVAHGTKPFQTVLIGPRLQGEALIDLVTRRPYVPAVVEKTRGMFSAAFVVEVIFFSGWGARIRDPNEKPDPEEAPVPDRQERPPLVVPAE
jgi:hypothetical protein